MGRIILPTVGWLYLESINSYIIKQIVSVGPVSNVGTKVINVGGGAKSRFINEDSSCLEEEMTLHPCPVLFGLPIYCDDDGDEDLDDGDDLGDDDDIDHDDKN